MLKLFTATVMLCTPQSVRSLLVTVNGKVSGLRKLVSDVHQPIKLPVWPVWSGVIAQCFDWIKAPQVSESIISSIGGRVVPITLSNLDVSPFLLLAHHSHSFTPLDPVRALTKLFLPEGFPAHPHSGFDTVTYCIDGGLRHRDSEGIKMSYADGDVQWMRAGRGVIHEEMWDLRESDWAHKKIEIFQLWVNLPARAKGKSPSLQVLKKADIPDIDCGSGSSIKVICGSLHDASSISASLPVIEQTNVEGPGTEICQSPVSILHLNMRNADSCIDMSTEVGCTVTVYVRKGSMMIDNGEREIRAGDCVIFRNPTPLTSSSSSGAGGGDEDSESMSDKDINQVAFSLTAGSSGLDALVLSGKPLNEPVIWQGPLVLADEESFVRSARGFNSISRTGYWDHKIGDEEWSQHVQDLDLQKVISNTM